MPRLTKDQIQALTTLDDNSRADIVSLLTDIEEREGQISKLRAKVEDSDKVVARNAELENLSKTQKTEIDLLNQRLAGTGVPPVSIEKGLAEYPVFSAVFAFLNGDETPETGK